MSRRGRKRARARADAIQKGEPTAAVFGVFCPGILDVLSIGKGDLRLEVGTSPEDRDRAKDLIGEMLRKGYSIFVETDDGPVRVHGFIAERMVYVIVEDDGDPEAGPASRPPKAGPPSPRKRGGRKREVPVAGSQATAVGRTSGG